MPAVEDIASGEETPRRALRLTDPMRELLTPAQQDAYLQMLARGASPAAACLQLGLSLATVAATLEADEQFASLLQRIQSLLSQNVAAALYRSAMEGSVTAQQFYLKNRPPPEWPVDVPNSHSVTFDALTDEELQLQFRAAVADFLAADSSRLGTSDRAVEPGGFPSSDLH